MRLRGKYRAGCDDLIKQFWVLRVKINDGVVLQILKRLLRLNKHGARRACMLVCIALTRRTGTWVSERGHRHVHIVFEHIFAFLVWTREYI